MGFQGVDHFHNGTVHAYLGTAVVHIVVAAHHAFGDAVQRAGVLAQLAQHAADDEEGQNRADENAGRQQDGNLGLGRVIQFITGKAGFFAAFRVERHNFEKLVGGLEVGCPGLAEQQRHGLLGAILLGKGEYLIVNLAEIIPCDDKIIIHGLFIRA